MTIVSHARMDEREEVRGACSVGHAWNNRENGHKRLEITPDLYCCGNGEARLRSRLSPGVVPLERATKKLWSYKLRYMRPAISAALGPKVACPPCRKTTVTMRPMSVFAYDANHPKRVPACEK